MAQTQYKKYKTDAGKAKVYDHRLRLAERENEKWHPEARAAWMRYEAKARPEAMSANGHNLSGSTPTYIGIIDSQYSSMTAADIDINVTAKGDTTPDQAYVASGAVSQEFQLSKANQRGAVSIKDALVCGIGWVKVGYEYVDEEQDVPRKREDIVAEVNRLIAEAQGSEGGPTALQIMDAVPLTEVQEIVLSDRIVVDYVPWDMMLLDPTAKQLCDVKWMAQKQFMTEDEIKRNPLFLEYAARNRTTKKLMELAPDTTIERGILGDRANPTKDDERFTVYTVYDYETGTQCTLTKDAGFLLNETVNPFSINDDMEDKSPFVPIVLRHTSSRVRGVSETETLKAILQEKDIYHSRLATFLERAIPRWVAEEGLFTPAGKAALASQDSMAVIEVERGRNAKDELFKLDPPTLMSEMFNMPDRLEQSARDATGTSELQRGLFPDRKRTATETSEVVAASAARASEKRLALEHFWKSIASRILQLMQLFYEQERIVKLVDDAGEVDWTWTAADIVGGYDLEISLTPKEAKSWQQRRDNALAVINVVAPLALPGSDGSSDVDMAELLRYGLTEMGIPRKIISMILNLPEEKQQQVLGSLQNQAQQANTAAGQPPAAAGVAGPLSEEALAAATNAGTIPPGLVAAAGGGNPFGPQGAERVSESRGVVGY